MAERLPPGTYDADNMRPSYVLNCLEQNGIHYSEAKGENHLRSDSISSTFSAASNGANTTSIHESQGPYLGSREANSNQHSRGHLNSNGTHARLSDGSELVHSSSSLSLGGDSTEPGHAQDRNYDNNSRNSASAGNGDHVEAEWIEQYEPGVYITLVALRDGTRDLKRVRFRYLYPCISEESLAYM